jgi:multicomponent Na+:H+ antiporter subunit G
MMEVKEIFSLLIIIAGAFFMLVGSIGVIRLPDFFTRIHASSKCDTLGIMLVLGGLAVFEGFTLNSVKLIIAIVFVGLANPVGIHALAKAAIRFGIKPWFKHDGEETKRAERGHAR